MQLIRFSRQGNMVLLKNPNHTKGEEWFFLDPKVSGFAKTIAEGTEVEFKTEDRGGENTIIFIKANNGGVSQMAEFKCIKCGAPMKEGKYKVCYKCNMAKKEAPASAVAEFTCEKCGASLKDGKYKTCYTCSMEARKQEEASPEGQGKQNSIERLAIMKSAADAVATAMQGQVDINTLADQIEVLYDRLSRKFYQ